MTSFASSTLKFPSLVLACALSLAASSSAADPMPQSPPDPNDDRTVPDDVPSPLPPPPTVAPYPIAPAPGYPPDAQPMPAQPGAAPAPYYYYYPPPAPRTFHMEEKRRWGLFVAGLSTFAGMYTLTAAIAGLADEWRLAVPVVGPIVELAHYRERYDCGSPPPGSVYYCGTESSSDKMMYGLLVLDAVIQAGGLAMAAAGVFTKTQVKVWDTPLTLLPAVSPTGAGVSAFGRF